MLKIKKLLGDFWKFYLGSQSYIFTIISWEFHGLGTRMEFHPAVLPAIGPCLYLCEKNLNSFSTPGI